MVVAARPGPSADIRGERGLCGLLWDEFEADERVSDGRRPSGIRSAGRLQV